jgi:phosphoribosyl-AMP cyclohydrolase
MSDELRAAIVQDDATGRVLMLGWMDEEALALTRSSGLVHFYSRSRQKLWRKGETSVDFAHRIKGSVPVQARDHRKRRCNQLSAVTTQRDNALAA